MPQPFPVKPVLQFVKLATLYGERAQSELQAEKQARAAEKAAESQAREKIAQQVSPLVTYLRENNLLTEGEIKQAGDLLNTHEGALLLFKSAAEKVVELQKTNTTIKTASLGAGVPDPKASAHTTRVVPGSLASPLCGVKTAGLKDSDLELRKILDPPTR